MPSRKLAMKKILSILGITAIVLGAGSTVPIVPSEMKWVVSYETIMFDTADGDLATDEYAVAGEGEWYVRSAPKNKAQFELTTNAKDIEGKKEVGIRAKKTPENQACTGCAYYSEFMGRDGQIERVLQQKKEYEDLKTVKNAPQPKKLEFKSLFAPDEVNAAIAFVATSSTGRVANSSGQSFSHTVSGTDPILFVFPSLNDVTATDRDVTAATYNGDALTLYTSQSSATIETHFLYRLAPDSGSNTVSLTYGGTNSSANTSAMTLSGVRQTSATPVTSQGTPTIGYKIYSPVAGSWAIGVFGNNANSPGCAPTGNGVARVNSNSGTGALSQHVLTLENISADTLDTIDWDCTSSSNVHSYAIEVFPSCDPATEECIDTFMFFTEPSISSLSIATTSVTNYWIAPTGVSSAVGACWGGGGGGGAITNNGGGGGGGGGYASSNLTVSAGTSYPFVTSGSAGAVETAGGNSYFNDGTVLLAAGGSGAADATGGAGGSTGTSIGGIVEYAGGDGGNGDNTNDAGGGGGGSAGPSGAGNNGSAGTTVGGDGGSGNAGSGGAGGAGGNATQGADGGANILGGGGGGGGDDGISCPSGSVGNRCYGGYLGGGGGGSETSGNRGAVGMCRITYGSAGGGTPDGGPAIFYFKNSDVRVKDADVRVKE